MNVKKTLVFSISLIAISLSVFGQETTSPQKRFARPNIPGTFVLELGLNRAQNRPEKFFPYFWGSRAVNVYYQYDMRILKSKFSFHPGIGLGFERYRFRKGYILGYDKQGTLSMLTQKDYGDGISGLRKSQLITNYLDVPLELRFSANPEDPARSFKVSIGVRGGVLLNSHTKVKYKEEGNKIKIKDNRNFNLNQFRYGVFLKIGAGNFSIFSYYNLSTVFKTDRGPVYGNSTPTAMTNFTVGISLASF